MPGPIDNLRFVHAAILRETDDLDAAVAAAETPEDAGVLLERIEYYADLVDGHTRGEEIGLFPPLLERDESMADTYLFDHVEERACLEEAVSLTRACANGDEGALARLKRQMVVIATHTHSHVAKENELLLPRVTSLFSIDEQAEMLANIVSKFSEEGRATSLVWIISRLDDDTAVGYAEALSATMPPPVFEAAKGWIRDGVDDERWTMLVGRVATLAVDHDNDPASFRVPEDFDAPLPDEVLDEFEA